MPERTDLTHPKPTKKRPLNGTSILLVEDSRYSAEAVRLFARKSGARLRRADCLATARRHLAAYRPDLVIVDIGLPDGSGLDFLAELRALLDMPPGLMAISGDAGSDMRQSLEQAGVTTFLAKPLTDLRAFQRAVQRALGAPGTGAGFQPQIADSAGPQLDMQAFVDDIGHMQDLLRRAIDDCDAERGKYAAQFACSVATVSGDAELLTKARRLQQKLKLQADWRSESHGVLDRADALLRKGGTV